MLHLSQLCSWFLSRQVVRPNRRARLSLESLEDRRVPALFLVGNTDDDGIGSLRAAVRNANDAPGTDVIRFENNVIGVIDLSSELPSLTDAVAIEGPGASALTVRAATEGQRILSVEAGVTASITELTLTGGSAESLGGAILNLGDLTLTGVTFTGNQAGATELATGMGGAVYSTGRLRVVSSTFHSNFAGLDGGAIRSEGSLEVVESSFSDNGAGRDGGAISATAAATITSSTLEVNKAGRHGGAVRHGSGTLEVRDSNFALNEVFDGDGGAIYATDTLRVVGSFFEENTAGQGGALMNRGTANLVQTTFTANSADEDGGAIHNEGTLTLRDSTLSENVATAGGALSNHDGTSGVFNSTFSLNGAQQGGAIFVEAGTVTLTHATVTQNVAAQSGGGVRVEAATLNLFNTIVAGNTNEQGAADDIVGSVSVTSRFNLIGIDPQLGPLADNGGPTATHALLEGSPALDAGGVTPLAPTADQRGLPRSGTPDIGAFEVQGDDDATPGVILRNPTARRTTEAGGSVEIEVVLASRPSANVLVALVSSDASEATTSAPLLFTPDNWSIPQVARVTGVDDTQRDGDVSYTVFTRLTTDDPSYANSQPASAPLVNADDERDSDPPANQPNVEYVRGLYRLLLGRDADATGVAASVALLDAGVSHQMIVEGINRSEERFGLVVDDYYRTYLHRQAEAAGRAGWVNHLLAGQSEEWVIAQFLTSQEYLQANPPATDFLGGLYRDLFGRTATTEESAGWLDLLRADPSAAGRATVVEGFLYSLEYQRREVDGYYRTYLGRPLDAEGEQAWLPTLHARSLSLSQVAEAILASDEFRG